MSQKVLPEFSNSSKKNQNKLLRNKARLRTLGKNLVGSRSRVRSTSIVGESSSAVSYSEKNLINPESRVGSKYLEGRERKRGGPYIHRRQNFSSGSIYQIPIFRRQTSFNEKEHHKTQRKKLLRVNRGSEDMSIDYLKKKVSYKVPKRGRDLSEPISFRTKKDKNSQSPNRLRSHSGRLISGNRAKYNQSLPLYYDQDYPVNQVMTEIDKLTKTIDQLKLEEREILQRYGIEHGLQNLPDISHQSKVNEAFRQLLKENRRLKEENESLRRRNKWLTQKLDQQIDEGNKSTVYSLHKSNRMKELEATRQLSNWYFLLSEMVSKLTSSYYRNISKPSFTDCLSSFIKDITRILPVEKFMYKILIDGDICDIVKNKGAGEKNLFQFHFPERMNSYATQRTSKILKNLETFKQLFLEENFCFIPIKLNLPFLSIKRKIGVIVLELRRSEMKDSLSANHKITARFMTEFISSSMLVYKERNRHKQSEIIFKKFMKRISSFLSSEDLFILLKNMKFELKKIFNAQDVAITYYDPLNTLLYGLNPSYTTQQLKAQRIFELSTFNSNIGITSTILNQGGFYCKANPRTDTHFSPQIDNLTPVKDLKHLCILRLETEDDRIIGIMQIINRVSELSDKDYINICSYVAKVCGNIFNTLKRVYDDKETLIKLRRGVERIKAILNVELLESLGFDETFFETGSLAT